MDGDSNPIHLTDGEFERLRDSLVVAARRMSKEQILELSDNLHVVLRRRHVGSWEEARRDTAGFA